MYFNRMMFCLAHPTLLKTTINISVTPMQPTAWWVTGWLNHQSWYNHPSAVTMNKINNNNMKRIYRITNSMIMIMLHNNYDLLTIRISRIIMNLQKQLALRSVAEWKLLPSHQDRLPTRHPHPWYLQVIKPIVRNPSLAVPALPAAQSSMSSSY